LLSIVPADGAEPPHGPLGSLDTHTGRRGAGRAGPEIRFARAGNIHRPIEEIRAHGRVRGSGTQQIAVDRRRRIVRAGPELLIGRRLLLAYRLALSGLLAIKRNCNDILSDRQPVAVAQLVRRLEAPVAAIEKCPVRRDVVKPISAVAVADLAML
jgi:hypothetical protein